MGSPRESAPDLEVPGGGPPGTAPAAPGGSGSGCPPAPSHEVRPGWVGSFSKLQASRGPVGGDFIRAGGLEAVGPTLGAGTRSFGISAREAGLRRTRDPGEGHPARSAILSGTGFSGPGKRSFGNRSRGGFLPFPQPAASHRPGLLGPPSVSPGRA